MAGQKITAWSCDGILINCVCNLEANKCNSLVKDIN